MKPCVITIGREFCSGGAQIGKCVAEYFDIPYYDKKMMDETREILKISKEIAEKHDEKRDSYWDVPGYQYWYSGYFGDPSMLLPMGARVAQTQFNLMRRYAQEGPCVIVGRCADSVLKNYPDAVHVFIHASQESRVERCMRLYALSEEKAKKLIKKTDKIRSSFYNHYVGEEWGEPSRYHLYIDAGRLGVRASVEEIIDYIKNERR